MQIDTHILDIIATYVISNDIIDMVIKAFPSLSTWLSITVAHQKQKAELQSRACYCFDTLYYVILYFCLFHYFRKLSEILKNSTQPRYSLCILSRPNKEPFSIMIRGVKTVNVMSFLYVGESRRSRPFVFVLIFSQLSSALHYLSNPGVY